MKRLLLLLLTVLLLTINAQAMIVYKSHRASVNSDKAHGVLCLSIANKYMAIGKTAVRIAHKAGTSDCNSRKFKRAMIRAGYYEFTKLSSRAVGRDVIKRLRREYVKAGGDY